MTVNEYFKSLLSQINLSLDDAERKLIENKQNDLREALREKLTLEDDFLTGSYIRNTLIKPTGNEKFDVDVFIAFSNDEYGESDLGELHDMVVSALEAIKAENTELGITKINDSQRRSVGVEFGNNFQIDAVPAIQIEKDTLYKIFDKRTLKSIKSNPKLHGKLLSEANERTGGMLIPIVKLLKSWKRSKCDYVKSFHLELLAVNLLGGGSIDSYAEGIAQFFSEAISKLDKPYLMDPANNTYYIDAYLDDDGTRSRLLELITTENEVAEQALSADDESDATKLWMEIFTDDDSKIASGIAKGSFYPVTGGVKLEDNPSTNEEPVKSPRSWGT